MAQPPKGAVQKWKAQSQKGLRATLIHCRNPEKRLQVQQQIAEIGGFAENPPKHHRNRRCIPAGTPANPNPAGSPGNPPKHRGNLCYIPVARTANPTKTQKCRRWCDGATPNLETFQRFCIVASGSNIKNKHQTSRFQVGWHNQLWNGAMRWYKMSRPFEVSKFQKSAPSLRALS